MNAASADGRPFDIIVVESSPLLRCMQTATFICRQLGVPKIQVNYNFREWLSKGIFSDSPIGRLYLENRSKELVLDQMGGDDVDFEIPDEFADKEKNRKEMKYPESRDLCN